MKMILIKFTVFYKLIIIHVVLVYSKPANRNTCVLVLKLPYASFNALSFNNLIYYI